MSTTTNKVRSGSNETSTASARYEEDLYGWVEQQVALLKAGRLTEIDAGNIAEELSDVGGEQYDRLESSIRVVLLHLLKWDHQPERRSRSWMLSIAEHRRRVLRVLKKNPSLKSSLDEAVDEAYEDAKGDAWRETGLPGDTFARVCPYVWDEIMSRAIVFDDLQSPEQ
ncbi:MAG TPA: DUF29 domain-containing protein [Tardiphaga sp.]